MCGRFVLITALSAIARDFNISEISISFDRSRNVAPGRPIPAVVGAGGGNLLKSFFWGLVPFWAKDPSVGARLINARAETVAQKPSFKHAFAKRRCLIPADGFYEWKKEGGKKIPYCFGLKSGAPFYFAGLYEKWTAPDQKPLESCTIITTQANETVAPVHDRMPVIVPAAAHALWLNPALQDPGRLLDILKPYSTEKMICAETDLSGPALFIKSSRTLLSK